jgi:hypothetical protein
MSFERWTRLDSDVQQLVYDLAERQRFRCVFCTESRRLIIDHDHYPEEGTGAAYTKYNVRGLLCGSCNWHLGYYECEKSGGSFNWPNAECRISDGEYEDYICAYQCRVIPLLQALQDQRTGITNEWRRNRHHRLFDEWYYHGFPSAWRERLAEEKARTIDSAEKFFRVFAACMNFVAEQIKNDPSFRPPQKFVEVALKVKDLIAEARAATRAGDRGGLSRRSP